MIKEKIGIPLTSNSFLFYFLSFFFYDRHFSIWLRWTCRRRIGATDRPTSDGCPPNRTSCAKSVVCGKWWNLIRISDGRQQHWWRPPLQRRHGRQTWPIRPTPSPAIKMILHGRRRRFSHPSLSILSHRQATVTSWCSIGHHRYVHIHRVDYLMIFSFSLSFSLKWWRKIRRKWWRKEIIIGRLGS